jgi:hypothetical protein
MSCGPRASSALMSGLEARGPMNRLYREAEALSMVIALPAAMSYFRRLT